MPTTTSPTSSAPTSQRVRTKAALLVAALLAGPLVPTAGAAALPDTGATDHRPSLRTTLQQDADALLAQGAPGVLAELRTPGREVRVRSGLGDVARRTPVPWRARFRIASLTKTFVATTVLQLVGEGRLSLDDTVERWLPGLVRGHGNDGRTITVRQLLQHTSGLPEYLLEMPWLVSEDGFQEHRYDTLSARGAVRLAMRREPDFAPGTSWHYSNTGYAVVGLVIEAVTGRSWQAEVRRRIVRPLGLHGTTVPETRTDIPGPNARGYERFPGPGATAEDLRYGDPIDATRLNPSWTGAAGAIISTTDDVNRFLLALVGGDLLAPEQLAQMQRTVPTDDAFRQNWPGSRYGLGLMWVPNDCGGSWSHGGDVMGFQTRDGVSADGRRSVVVSLNTDSLQREPGAPELPHDVTTALIEHALCGSD